MSLEQPETASKDLWGGLFLVGTGLAFGLVAWLEYPIGTVLDMGPGMFPMMLGLLLALLGLMILLPALWRVTSMRTDIEWRPLLTIAAGVVAFILTIERFGLAVAVLSLTWLSTLAIDRLSFKQAMALGGTLTLAAMVIFVYGFGVPIPVFTWNLQ